MVVNDRIELFPQTTFLNASVQYVFIFVLIVCKLFVSIVFRSRTVESVLLCMLSVTILRPLLDPAVTDESLPTHWANRVLVSFTFLIKKVFFGNCTLFNITFWLWHFSQHCFVLGSQRRSPGCVRWTFRLSPPARRCIESLLIHTAMWTAGRSYAQPSAS